MSLTHGIGTATIERWDHRQISIVRRVADRASQTNLDAHCASSGSTSVKAAIEADRSLGGKALDCRVTQMTNQGSLAIGDVTYHTAEFNVTVIAAG